jgi:hypothetical protein
MNDLAKYYLQRLQEAFGADTIWVSLNEAALYLKSSRVRLLKDKTFPVKKIGKTSVVPLANLAQWLAS